MPPTAYLFDVNETLLDLTALDGPVFGGDEALRRRWFGQLVQSALLTTLLGGYRAFGELGAAALEVVAPEADAERLREGIATLPPHPDVRPALDRLRAAGVRCAALTQNTPDVLRRQLEAAGLADAFELACSADDAGRLKPAPEPYLLAVRRLGLEPAQVTMVAAHTWDVAGARAAGLDTVLVTRPGVVPDPSQPPPGRIVADLEAL
jgi:2-haloacid dehalogenase